MTGDHANELGQCMKDARSTGLHDMADRLANVLKAARQEPDDDDDDAQWRRLWMQGLSIMPRKDDSHAKGSWAAHVRRFERKHLSDPYVRAHRVLADLAVLEAQLRS